MKGTADKRSTDAAVAHPSALELEVLEVLARSAGIRALDIARTLDARTDRADRRDLQRCDINRALYSLQKQGAVVRSEECPPRWRLVGDASEPTVARCSSTIVLVDLGNVHDALKPLQPYAENGTCEVHAFADYAFNGYGVCPPAPPPIRVHRSATPDKNAADIRLVWLVADMIHRHPANSPPLDFYVLTKDQGFRSLGALVEESGHAMRFLRAWDELRPYIE